MVSNANTKEKMRHYKVSGKSIVFKTEVPCSATQAEAMGHGNLMDKITAAADVVVVS